MDQNNLPGPLKVAILINSLGEPTAGDMLNSMNTKERNLIESQLQQIGSVSPAMVEKVIEEFSQLLQNPALQNLNAPGALAGGVEGAGGESSPLQTLQSIDAEQLVDLIKNEHPQTIALIMVHLHTGVASEVMSMLDEEVKIDVSLRIASMDKVIAGMIDEIDHVFKDILKNSESTVTQKTDGVDCLAEILTQTDEISTEQIMAEIEEKDPQLAARIKQKMFVFEDLTKVDDRGLQKVLRQVETRELSIALKGASDEVKNKIYRNMSQRAAEMLQEEIDSVGAVRMKEVEDSQHAITSVIQDLEKKGEVVISGRGGEEYIA